MMVEQDAQGTSPGPGTGCMPQGQLVALSSQGGWARFAAGHAC